MAGPYLCPALVWTIGYGSTRYESGAAVAEGDHAITRERAHELLSWSLQRDLVTVYRLCPALADEPEHRAAAIASFVYNLGPGRLQASTLRRRINERDWPEAALELQKWVWAGGRKLAGLVARRADEAALLLQPSYARAA